MFAKALGRLKCRYGVHQRSRRLARHDAVSLRSECTFCGTAMHKLASGKWVKTRQDG